MKNFFIIKIINKISKISKNNNNINNKIREQTFHRIKCKFHFN
jgi:hypothetical protein